VAFALFAEELKYDEDEFLPGAPAAMSLLRQLADQAGARGTTYLITWRRGSRQKWRPIKGVRYRFSPAP